jgi:UPF0755 protein
VRRVAVSLVVLVVAVGVLAGGAWVYMARAVEAPLLDHDAVVDVPKGMSGNRLSRLLVDTGLLQDGLPFIEARVYLRRHPVLPKAGKHALKRGMSLAQALETFAGEPLVDDVPVTIVEGWRLADTDDALSAATPPYINKGSYRKAASDPSRFKAPFTFEGADLEGYLYPDTYAMPLGHFEVDRLIQRQLDSFSEKFAVPYADEIKKSGRSLHDLVIVASMLEREERNPAVRPEIAGVMYTRLRRKVPLGIDATSRYTLKDWNDPRAFLVKLRDPADLYNTRLRDGLPHGPIGSPSLPSLLAALRPHKNEWLYYLHDKEGNVHFARTAAEHEANRKRYNVY